MGQGLTPDRLAWLSGCEQSTRSLERLWTRRGFCVCMVMPWVTNTHLNVTYLSSHWSSASPLLAVPMVLSAQISIILIHKTQTKPRKCIMCAKNYSNRLSKSFLFLHVFQSFCTPCILLAERPLASVGTVHPHSYCQLLSLFFCVTARSGH